MAHEIEQLANGAHAFVAASNRISPWHRLGTVLTDKELTAQQVMRHAYLGGWDVRKLPVSTEETIITLDGVTTRRIEVADQFVTVRTNPVTKETEALGVVGAKYLPIQNEEHCDLLNTLADEAGACFDTAGSLREGREVFVTMKLPETMTIAGTDQIDLYIAALNAHDGRRAFQFVVSPVRVVCANTQAMALKEAVSTFSIRHTNGASGHIAQARETLGLTRKYLDAFEAEAQRMIEKEITRGQFEQIIDQIWLPPKTETEKPGAKSVHADRKDILMGLLDAETQKPINGTAWGGYQAVIELVDHFSTASTPEIRAQRALIGRSARVVKEGAHRLFAAV